ncbi:MAG: hypothetical protein JSR20_06130 [Nitrospira sp.]|nr:hypothetical protein [Nitrospira sp.]
MNTFTIEKGIPVVERKRPGSLIELPDWEVGDSFVVDSKSRAAYLATRFKRRGQKVTCRQIDGGQVRIWRIA